MSSAAAPAPGQAAESESSRTLTGDWLEMIADGIQLVGTPCFVMSAAPVATALKELTSVPSALPRRHWLSMKTQPVRPLLELWHSWGLGVEVVSEYELEAALRTGFSPDDILVNGVAKHSWLPRFSIQGLQIHLDSVLEAQQLLSQAKAERWRVGLRCQAPAVVPHHRIDQFGLTLPEAVTVCQLLRRHGTTPRGVHCHLHTNVIDVQEYLAAVRHLRHVCDEAHLDPDYVDIGGGLPARGESLYAWHGVPPFALTQLSEVYGYVATMFPTASQVWQENGRYMSARAAALAITVLDRKDTPERSFLICDGGRTNHARLADIELHDIAILPARVGPLVPTVVCGPTCSPVDRLGTWNLPSDICPGDVFVWMNAGAYHIPLETRFSVGKAPMVWFDERGAVTVARHRETAAEWWAQWACTQ
jgi:diaminopimelate decarboxylase